MKKLFTLVCVAAMYAHVFAYTTPEFSIVETSVIDDLVQLKVHYSSVGADGMTPAMVSGIVTYPVSKQAEAILMDNHFTITKDANAPSNSIPQIINNDYFSMGGVYCFTSADYLGYGLTVSHPHTYLCQKQNAQNSIDLMKVARKIYADSAVVLNYDAFVATGYSQGGGVTMAVHREMELNKQLAEELHFAGSYCGAGPYDLQATMDWYFSQTTLTTPSLLPLVIRGQLAGGFLSGHSFGDFFRAGFDSDVLLSAIDAKESTLSELSDIILSQTGGVSAVSAFVHEDLLNPSSQLYADFMVAVEANTLLDGWHPSFPLHICHYEGDSIVPYVNAQSAVAALEVGENFQQLAPQQYIESDHEDFAMYYYRYIYGGSLTSMLEGEQLGVKHPHALIPMDGVRYNILGMPVDESYHGIVIVNGKKYLQ